MNVQCLRAIAYAHAGEYQRARDMLYDIAPRCRDDERDLDYALTRVEELQDTAVARIGGAQS